MPEQVSWLPLALLVCVALHLRRQTRVHRGTAWVCGPLRFSPLSVCPQTLQGHQEDPCSVVSTYCWGLACRASPSRVVHVVADAFPGVLLVRMKAGRGPPCGDHSAGSGHPRGDSDLAFRGRFWKVGLTELRFVVRFLLCIWSLEKQCWCYV